MKTKSTLIQRATATHYQIRQHRSGCFQVFRRRWRASEKPAYTSWTLDGAMQLAARKPAERD